MNARRWLERGVIAVAALASIATSRKRWHLEATPPPHDTHAVVMVVEASRMPQIIEATNAFALAPLTEPHWPGRASYLVPAGSSLEITMLGDTCKGGACEDPDCTVPAGEYLRVVGSTSVATWRKEATGASAKVTLRPHHGAWQTVRVTRTPGNLSGHIDSSLPGDVRVNDAELTVIWPAVASQTEVTWTPHVILEGPCPTEAPCDAPADATLVLGAAVEDGYDEQP